MASTYKTPGVYVEEISLFPPSVAQVDTAVPAFIGYTEKQGSNGELANRPVKIRSLLEYEALFGGAPSVDSLNVVLNASNTVIGVTAAPAWYLYQSMQLFFANGGGKCYIVSVGTYTDAVNANVLVDGVKTLLKEDEPTMLVCPDSMLLTDINEVAKVHTAMLSQAEKLMDRFCILDVYNGDEALDANPGGVNVANAYRNAIPLNSNLKYGAAYYPFLNTSLPLTFSYEKLKLKDSGGAALILGHLLLAANQTVEPSFLTFNSIKGDESVFKGILTRNLDEFNAAGDKDNYINDYRTAFNGLVFTNDELKTIHTDYQVGVNSISVSADENSFTSIDNEIKAFQFKINTLKYNELTKLVDAAPLHFLEELADDYEKFNKLVKDNTLELFKASGNKKDYIESYKTAFDGVSVTSPLLVDSIEKKRTEANNVQGQEEKDFTKVDTIIRAFLSEIKQLMKKLETQLIDASPIYKGIVNSIRTQGVVVPPSGAMAGVYAATDTSRGVWKAPANVGLNLVKAPSVKVTHSEQEELNIHDFGKSINAIRAFTGKGVMVWGARTLAGNSNEWRYISVTRTFAMAEESIKKATEHFVFEPNDANTWVKVRSMIESFLTKLWRAGALAGASPEQAFYVRVGLGVTMTTDDVNEGIMNVEIGMAVVRPAEFIILKFSHKMQEV